MWINNPVLCLGDPKFGDGCAGFTLYYPLWALLYSPLVAFALFIARPKKLRGVRYARGVLLSLCLIVTLIALEVSFVLDVSLLVLIAEWISLGVLFFLFRSLLLSESRKAV